MAAPVDAGRATTNITTAADPWASVNLPSSIASGDLLLAWVRFGGAGQFAAGDAPGGWAIFGGLAPESPDASDDNICVLLRVSAGGEPSTESWDLTASQKGAVIIWRITGAGRRDTGAPITTINISNIATELSAATTTTGANIDPASFTPSAPGGTKDYLFLSVIGMDSETATATNGTLSNVANANSGTGGAVATNCMIWGGSQSSSSVSSVNIAAWTSTAPATGAVAYTIAVYPVAATGVARPELVVLQAVNRSSVY